MVRKRTCTTGIIVAVILLMFMFFFPARVHAATNLYACKGVTAGLTFQSAPVPNAAWTVGNSSIVKIKSSSPIKVLYVGKRVGQTTLTVYNRRQPAQRYSWTVYIMPAKKLNRMDFEVYGSVCTNWLGVREGSNLLDNYTSNTGSTRVVITSNVNSSNTGSFFQTTRTAALFDSYSRICTLYGKKSLKRYTFNKDRYYRYICSRQPNEKQAYVNYIKRYVTYYVDYKYGKKCMIRFFFNSNRKLTMVQYFKNYNNLPIF